ncbi:MAG: NusG domain II-containing protein [Clostridiales bacterium]|nr:NusG domain II-containing protein [Clostridiales bacterium]
MSWGSRPPAIFGGRAAGPLTWCSSRRTGGCFTPPAWPTIFPKRGQTMTSKRSQPELKPKPLDALVVLAVLLLGVAAAWLAYGGENSGALTATVKHRGQVVARVELSSLTEEKTVSIDGAYHLTVTLDRTGAAVTDSDCPGQDCLHTGRITRAGQSIVCLPEQVIVTLEGKAPSPDVVLG